MKQFITSDSKGKAIYKGDLVFYRLQPEATLRAVEIQVEKGGDVYLVCDPYRKVSIMNCVASKHTMVSSSFYDMTKRKK